MPDRPRTAYALFVLFAINAMNFYDRQVLGAVGEPIREEWGLSDAALGWLGTAFTLFYAAVGLPLGRLADVASRKHILAAGVLFWSLLTAAQGAARGFWQLFVLRLGVGAGEASCAPAATSFIGDLFPAARRGMALSLFMAGLPVGVAASYFVSGRVAASHGWRAAFWIAALPGILCAAAALGLREPRRGASESGAPRAATPPAGTGVAPYLKLLSIPTLWWVIASGALHNFNMYAVGAFLSPYLMRYHELDVRQANDIAMVAAGLAGLPGLYVGGLVADRAYRRRRNGRLLAAALASAASAPLVYLALSRPPGDIAAFTVLMALGSALMYAYYSMVYATIQDIVAPASRGSAMALYFFAMYVLGASLGPVGTGMLSDLFTRRAAETAGVTAADASALAPFRAEGLHTAMYIVPLLGLLLAAVLFAGARTVERDIERSRA